MKHRDLQDLAGGLALSALGLFVAFYARQSYDFGTAARMGPGFFPTILGWMLAVLGLLVAVPAFFRSGSLPQVEWRTFAIVMGSVLAFAFSLKTLGLIPATALAVFLSSLADREITWRGRALVVAGVTAVTVLIFVTGLGMILPLWWWSI
ncbi:tripartite tricarboxylate transporter TctB family protein [Caldimonas tepidiphila]|uniref:tripartite tricarboxylate transporter TctB family protein n=1 Tax=Caldimonas tepidiphila TaxID=2315841 RepID=UPI000E5C3ACA|nr:tripartite tricarboxylate transporter TctB family protein [Caldimonas tepidiphila]